LLLLLLAKQTILAGAVFPFRVLLMLLMRKFEGRERISRLEVKIGLGGDHLAVIDRQPVAGEVAAAIFDEPFEGDSGLMICCG
jgi:hypothetical protein